MPSDNMIIKYLVDEKYSPEESKAIGAFVAWFRSQINQSKQVIVSHTFQIEETPEGKYLEIVLPPKQVEKKEGEVAVCDVCKKNR